VLITAVFWEQTAKITAVYEYKIIDQMPEYLFCKRLSIASVLNTTNKV
jgi:hypothetical protein